MGCQGHGAHQEHAPEILEAGLTDLLGISRGLGKDSNLLRESTQVTSSILAWSFRLGRVFGIEVKIHWTFLLFILFRMLQGGDPLWSALFLTILFGSVLVHEFGHCFAARRYGLRADQILLWPFGGLAFIAPGRSAREDFWVAFGGPLTHIPTALLSLGGLMALGGSPHLQPSLLDPVAFSGLAPGWPSLILLVIFKVQLMLFAFNVLTPAYPMDGGRMLVALLLPRLGVDRTSGLLVVTTAMSGLVLLVERQSILGIFLLFSAYELWQFRKNGYIYSHPSFSHTRSYTSGSSSKVRKKARQVPYLRPVGKTCPRCKRSLPESARMCGYCEIEV